MIPLYIQMLVKGLFQHALWDLTLFVDMNRYDNQWYAQELIPFDFISSWCKQNQISSIFSTPKIELRSVGWTTGAYANYATLLLKKAILCD
jgi:hypothetical protein